MMMRKPWCRMERAAKKIRDLRDILRHGERELEEREKTRYPYIPKAASCRMDLALEVIGRSLNLSLHWINNATARILGMHVLM